MCVLNQVISPFSVAQAKEVIQSPVSSPTRKATTPPLGMTGAVPEEEELILVRRLVDECYTNHRRAFFGALPPEQCKLCSYTNGEGFGGGREGVEGGGGKE